MNLNTGKLSVGLPALLFFVGVLFLSQESQAQNELLPFRDGAKRGVVNRSGKKIVPPEYDFVGSLLDNYFVLTKKGNKKGLYTAQGFKVLDAVYDELSVADTQQVFFHKEGKMGLANDKKIILQAEYDTILNLNSGFVTQQKDGKFGLVNAYEAKVVLPPTYDFIRKADTLMPDRSNMFIAHEGKQMFVLGADGKKLEDRAFSEIELTDNGFLMVKAGKGWGAFNRKGEKVIDENHLRYAYLSPVSIALMNQEGNWGLFSCIEDRMIAETAYEAFKPLLDFPSMGKWYTLAKKDGKVGLLDDFGRLVIDYAYQNISSVGNGLMIAKKEGKWGLINKKNNVLLPFEYNYIYYFPEDLEVTKIKTENKEGLIDDSGKILIKPEYDLLEVYLTDAYDLSAKKKYDMLVMAYKGYEVTAFKFQDKNLVLREDFKHLSEVTVDTKDVISDVMFSWRVGNNPSDLRWWQRNTGKWLLITPKARKAIPKEFDWISVDPFTELTLAKEIEGEGKDEKIKSTYIIDHKTGKLVFGGPVKHIEISDLRFGKVARAATDTTFTLNALMLPDGSRLDNAGGAEIDSIGEIVEGMMVVKAGSKYGFLNTEGELSVPVEYEEVSFFEKGLAKVRKGGLYGYINKENKAVVPIKYKEISPMINGFAVVIDGGKYGLVNDKGEETVSPKYRRLSFVKSGVARAKLQGSWGLISPSGKEILPFSYKFIGEIRKGVAPIMDGSGAYGWVKTDGSFLLRPSVVCDFIGYPVNGIAPIGRERYEDPEDPVNKVKYRKNGFLRTDGSFIVKPEYEFIDDFEKVYADGKGLCLVYKNGKTGFLNAKGEEQIRATYDEVKVEKINELEDDDLIEVRKGSYVGYLNKRGKSILPAGKYKRVSRFENAFKSKNPKAMAAVKGDTGYGCINKEGKVVVPLEYDFAGMSPHNSLLAVVKKDGKWGVVNADAKLIIPIEYDKINYVHREGKALIELFRNEKKFTFYDAEGKFLASVAGLEAGMLSEGLIPLRRNDLWGFVDENGNEKIQATFEKARAFSDGLAPVKKDGKWGFTDKSGKTVVPANFEEVRAFKNGAAPAKKNGKWGLVGKTGNTVLAFSHASIGEFGENGLASISIMQDGTELFTFVNTKGQTVTKKFDFMEVRAFSEGIAPVKLFNKKREKQFWGYIKPDGSEALPFEYHDAHPFSDGMAKVKFSRGGRKFSYIDKKGTTRIRARYVKGSPFGESLAIGDGGIIFDKDAKVVTQATDGSVTALDGFKEGLMPVLGTDGYFHIQTDGIPLYKARFDTVTSFTAGLAFAKFGEKWQLTRKVERPGFEKLFETTLDYNKPQMLAYRNKYPKDRLVVNKRNEAFKDAGWKKIGDGNWRLINARGTYETDIIYEEMQGFGKGKGFMTAARGLYGYALTNGTILQEASCESKAYLYDDIVKIEQNGKIGYLTLDGKWILKAE